MYMLKDDSEIDFEEGEGGEAPALLVAIERAWLNEQYAPELLDYQSTLVNNLLEQINAQVRSSGPHERAREHSALRLAPVPPSLPFAPLTVSTYSEHSINLLLALFILPGPKEALQSQ